MAFSAEQLQLLEEHEAITSDNPFDILKLSREASDADIKKAYKQLALKFHPDKWSPGTIAEDEIESTRANLERAEAMFKNIATAFEKLAKTPDVYRKHAEAAPPTPSAKASETTPADRSPQTTTTQSSSRTNKKAKDESPYGSFDSPPSQETTPRQSAAPAPSSTKARRQTSRPQAVPSVQSTRSPRAFDDVFAQGEAWKEAARNFDFTYKKGASKTKKHRTQSTEAKTPRQAKSYQKDPRGPASTEPLNLPSGRNVVTFVQSKEGRIREMTPFQLQEEIKVLKQQKIADAYSPQEGLELLRGFAFQALKNADISSLPADEQSWITTRKQIMAAMEKTINACKSYSDKDTKKTALEKCRDNYERNPTKENLADFLRVAGTARDRLLGFMTAETGNTNSIKVFNDAIQGKADAEKLVFQVISPKATSFKEFKQNLKTYIEEHKGENEGEGEGENDQDRRGAHY